MCVAVRVALSREKVPAKNHIRKQAQLRLLWRILCVCNSFDWHGIRLDIAFCVESIVMIDRWPLRALTPSVTSIRVLNAMLVGLEFYLGGSWTNFGLCDG